MMLAIVQVRFMLKTKLSFHDRSDQVPLVRKIEQDNDMTARTGAMYTKNDTKFM